MGADGVAKGTLDLLCPRNVIGEAEGSTRWTLSFNDHPLMHVRIGWTRRSPSPRSAHSQAGQSTAYQIKGNNGHYLDHSEPFSLRI